MNIRLSAITDVGKTRAINEDAVAVCADLEGQLWTQNGTSDTIPLGRYGAMLVIADGMGGENAGEVASSIAVETITNFFIVGHTINDEDSLTDASASALLAQAIGLADAAIKNRATTAPDVIGMGTTIVVIWVIDGRAHIAWCGDSRCYSFNPKKGLRRLTKDHSYVQELIDKGEITPKQAFNHPDSSIITRCLGDVDTITEPDIITYHINDGDLLLACSDGLCGYCDDKSIEKVLLNNFDNLSECKDNLLKLAMAAGGQDNITIALCATFPEGQQTPAVTLLTKIKRFLKSIF